MAGCGDLIPAAEKNCRTGAAADKDGTVLVQNVLSGVEVQNFPRLTDVILISLGTDGTLLATASRDGTVKLWDASSGQLNRTVSLSDHPVAFSPNSTRLATRNKQDGTASVWDTSSGLKLQTIPAQTDVKLVAFCPNDTRLLIKGADDAVTIWDLSSGEPKGHPILVHGLRAVAFPPPRSQTNSYLEICTKQSLPSPSGLLYHSSSD
jgi:WD40 repeat protein